MKRIYSAAPLLTAFIAGITLAFVAMALMMATSLAWPVDVDAQTANFRTPIACDQSVVVNTALAATAEIIALTANQRIHVCGFALSGGGATTAKFIRGTGTNCGSGTTDLTAPFEFADNVSLSYGNGVGTIFRLPVGTALCVTNTQAIQLSGVVTYAKF